jgi:GNAT superfamily N-acetyltransferase
MSRIRLAEPELADAQDLSDLASQTFVQSYESALPCDQLMAYVDEAFATERLVQEFKNPESLYLLAWDDARVCAYANLHPSDLPASLSLAHAVELKRLYVLPDYCGQGLGTRLMKALLDWTSHRGDPTLWLRVWERNESAIRFYEHWAFHHVAQEPYHVGHCSETVQLMVRPLV